ncbi:hypothetical protein NDU88_012186 [Pleurodeles waltl]|uniref:Uncharacterized protein n=1 Tax=Pleurodeles waltl TaxID=8319 RepID=A0AAV7R552_PLEWA|nr:hypothetical protein NDU88_012186 [Pleurodeles waltl]
MGKGDPKQRKLAFDKQTPHNTAPTVAEMGNSVDGDSDTPPGTNAIFMELHAGFRAIDVRFDTIVGRLYRMGECLDRHDTRMAQSEDRIFETEDAAATVAKRLEVLETHLRTVQNLKELGRDRFFKIFITNVQWLP